MSFPELDKLITASRVDGDRLNSPSLFKVGHIIGYLLPLSWNEKRLYLPGYPPHPRDFDKDFLTFEQTRGEKITSLLEVIRINGLAVNLWLNSHEPKGTWKVVYLLCCGQALGVSIGRNNTKQNINSVCRKLSQELFWRRSIIVSEISCQ